MRSIISLIAMATVAFVAQGSVVPTLTTLYSKLCVGKAYAATSTTAAYTAYEPWEFIKGYALGTQIDIDDTKSTCYGQVIQTAAFVDSMVDGGYSMVADILSGNLNTFSGNVETMFQYMNNLVIQLSDQTIACQDSVKIKQLQTRTNKISGITNWAFTLGYGFFFDDIKASFSFLPMPATNQKIRTSGLSVYDMIANYAQGTTATIDCWDLGRQFGLFVSETLEAKVDSYVPLVEAQKLQ